MEKSGKMNMNFSCDIVLFLFPSHVTGILLTKNIRNIQRKLEKKRLQ